MSTGELMGLPILALGLWFALAQGRRAPAPHRALGFAWTVRRRLVVVPHYRHDDNQFFGFYDQIGGSPQGVLRTLFTDPGAVLGASFEGHDFAYLLRLGFPLLGPLLPLAGACRSRAAAAARERLSDFRSMTDPRYHSVAAVIPFLIAATVFGIARVSSARRSLAVGGVLACCLAMMRSSSDPGRAWSAGRRSVVVRSSPPIARGSGRAVARFPTARR